MDPSQISRLELQLFVMELTEVYCNDWNTWEENCAPTVRAEHRIQSTFYPWDIRSQIPVHVLEINWNYSKWILKRMRWLSAHSRNKILQFNWLQVTQNFPIQWALISCISINVAYARQQKTLSARAYMPSSTAPTYIQLRLCDIHHESSRLHTYFCEVKSPNNGQQNLQLMNLSSCVNWLLGLLIHLFAIVNDTNVAALSYWHYVGSLIPYWFCQNLQTVFLTNQHRQLEA